MFSACPMQLRMATLVSGLLVGLAGGCVKVPTPGVYKLDIQQGNVVTEEMLARLEPDMEKRKVRFLLGTPLITDTFNQDRWDYVYSLREGGGDLTQQHIVLIFEDDRLKHIEGDADNSAIDVPPEPKPETVVSVPDQKPDGIFGIGSWFGTDETRVPRKKPPPGDGDFDEEEGGFFANIFGGEDEAVTTAPAQSEESAVDDDQPNETMEETQTGESIATPEESLEEYDQNTATVDEESEDEDGFFARLKKKLEGSGEEQVEALAPDSPAETEDEEGFFERLSNQFGLDAPLEPSDTKN